MGKFEQAGMELGKLVDEKQKAYGDSITKIGKLLKVFLSDYYDHEAKTYTLPESMIDHVGMMVRIIDKQNRIFSNPDGDLMHESPYKDIAGYGLLGNLLISKEAHDED